LRVENLRNAVETLEGGTKRGTVRDMKKGLARANP
jgi:hypothetical protein